MIDDILDWLKTWADYPSVKATYGDKIHRAANEISHLRAENEKLRAALIGVTRELETFVSIFKGYQGMTMNNAQTALRAAAAALKETGG